MIKNFYYRFILVLTIVFGTLFVGSVPEMMKTSNWVTLSLVFFGLFILTYKEFGRLSNERRNEILYLDFFKKIGCDFSKE